MELGSGIGREVREYKEVQRSSLSSKNENVKREGSKFRRSARRSARSASIKMKEFAYCMR